MYLLSILFLVATFGISLWAMARVRGVYARYSEVGAASGVTGAQVADQILQKAGIHDVEIVEHNEMLGDHYDPTKKRLVLSSQNYRGQSLAALGVAAHECGHAIQHQIGYAPLEWRMAAVGITNYAHQGLTFVLIFGVMSHLLAPYTGLLLMAICWGIIMIFNLITLPVEFDASRRAKTVLAHMGFIRPGEEADGVRKTLDAAGWTYVAAFLTSLAYFLMYALPLLTGRDDRR